MNITQNDNVITITEMSVEDKQLLYDAMYDYYLHCDLTAKTNSVARDSFKDLATRAATTLNRMRNAFGQDIIY